MQRLLAWSLFANTKTTSSLRSAVANWNLRMSCNIERTADDLSPAEIARGRAQLKAGLLMGLESPASRAERLARLLSIWDRVPPIEDTVEKIDAVTTGDAREFAAGLVSRAEAALALYGPVSAAPDYAQLTGRLAA